MLSRRWPRLAGVAALTGVATQIGVVLLQFAPRAIRHPWSVRRPATMLVLHASDSKWACAIADRAM